MDYKHKIIQKNRRGLKTKFEEIYLLQQKENPSVFCLQETFLKSDQISLKGFNLYHHINTDCEKPSVGSSIFVKSSCPQRKINLNTELQTLMHLSNPSLSLPPLSLSRMLVHVFVHMRKI